MIVISAPSFDIKLEYQPASFNCTIGIKSALQPSSHADPRFFPNEAKYRKLPKLFNPEPEDKIVPAFSNKISRYLVVHAGLKPKDKLHFERLLFQVYWYPYPESPTGKMSNY